MFKKFKNNQEFECFLRAWHSKKVLTNFFLTEEEYTYHAKQFLVYRWEKGCYLLLPKQTHDILYFFVEQQCKLVPLPERKNPVLMEQVCLERKGQEPKATAWEEIGFTKYLTRKRLMMPMQTGIYASSHICFATEEQADLILEYMYEHFEPYTSALPTKEELLISIQNQEVLVVMNGDVLLGFLRYGAQKKVSVLWQIVVIPQARGKGIGRMLVKQWIWQVKEKALRCQLWVRTDNPSAQRMYEMLGFLPDGRIAPVMIKQSIKQNEKE